MKKRRLKLNSELVRNWLDAGGRKQSFLARQLGVSDSLVDLMLGDGHVPKERTLTKLAELMECRLEDLVPSQVKRAS